MKNLHTQKWGGAAALYEALAYVIGIVGFILVINISEISDPVQKVSAIVEHQNLLSLLHLMVYVFWGASLVVLSLALHDRLNGKTSALTRTATAFGLLWSVLVIASGMIYNIGMGSVVSINETNPTQAATVWLAIEAIFNGLGGGVEFVGGVWVMLLSITAIRNNGLSRWFNYFGIFVGFAGLMTIIPALSEIGGMIFGLTQILWFTWLGITLLKTKSEAATTFPTKQSSQSEMLKA